MKLRTPQKAGKTLETPTSTPDDPGLEEIAEWHRWFLSAHTQRLRDLNLPPDQHDRELADVTALASVVVTRLREEYSTSRRSQA